MNEQTNGQIWHATKSRSVLLTKFIYGKMLTMNRHLRQTNIYFICCVNSSGPIVYSIDCAANEAHLNRKKVEFAFHIHDKWSNMNIFSHSFGVWTSSKLCFYQFDRHEFHFSFFLSIEWKRVWSRKKNENKIKKKRKKLEKKENKIEKNENEMKKTKKR